MKKMLVLTVVFLAIVLAFTSSDSTAGHFEDREQPVMFPAEQRDGVIVPQHFEKRVIPVWVPERRGNGTFNLGFNWNWRTH